MNAKQAIQILAESNELLIGQMTKLSELVAGLEDQDDSDVKSVYNSLERCQQEYDAVAFAIKHLQNMPVRPELNSLIDIDAHVSIRLSLHYEVKDSKLYGGIGSTGYISEKFDDATRPEAADEAFISRQIGLLADTLKVPNSNIRLISKAEYDEKTRGSDNSLSIDVGR